MVARLLTLANGRVPRATRLLAWAGLALLTAAWVLLDPGHVGSPAAQASPPTTVLLPPRSAWVDRAELADPAGLFLRPPLQLDAPLVTAQPEATPFLAYGPDLRTQPGQPLATLPIPAPATKPDALTLLLQPEKNPLRTLGLGLNPQPPEARRGSVEVFSDSGELVISEELSQGDFANIIHKTFSVNNLKTISPSEFRLGIDAFGQQSPPFLTSPSRLPELDQAALQWVGSQPWAKRLPPGSYRIRIGP